MFPILFQFGHLTIHTLGLFLVLGFFTAGFLFWRSSKQEHYQEDELFDDFLLTSLWAMLMSRLGFILLHSEVFGLDVARWLDIFNFPGLSMVVGVLIVPIMMARFAAKRKVDVFEVLDFSALALSAGLVWYWLGAFFDGSLVGFPTSLPWGMKFPGVFTPHHPAQLYALGANLCVTLYLLWAQNKYRLFEWYRRKKNTAESGFLFSVWLITQGATQLLLLVVAPPQLQVGHIALDWYIYPLLIVIGLVALYKRSGRDFLGSKRRPSVAQVGN